MTDRQDTTSEPAPPRVSVLMATHNVRTYLQDAADSILGQSFGDFEFLIVDDASTDGTWEALQDLARRDRRIRLFRNERNLGLPESLNRLVPEVRGEYIARMDADDIATPDRFAIQVETLDHGEVDLCGSAFVEFPARRPRVTGTAMGDAQIKLSLLFEWSVMHPTVMMKSGLLRQERYRADRVPAADYDLWVRLAKVARMRNLPDVLLLKRVHGEQISSRHAARRYSAAMQVCRMALEDVGIRPSDREVYLQSRLWTEEKPETWEDVVDTEAWLTRLSTLLDDRPEASRHLSARWYVFCLKAAPYGWKTFQLFRRSPLFRLHPYSAGELLAALVLCVTRVAYRSPTYWALVSLHPASRRKHAAIRSLPTPLRWKLRG
ncbi:glycosyltransferase family 2 protein [Frateuria sp. GZRR33]|uniref:glycosyltransferase family 2 protein n=1 Tax=Frateuria sp. GZRR33 TaxID=3351535 RepID=UPI003EDBF0DA